MDDWCGGFCDLGSQGIVYQWMIARVWKYGFYLMDYRLAGLYWIFE